MERWYKSETGGGTTSQASVSCSVSLQMPGHLVIDILGILELKKIQGTFHKTFFLYVVLCKSIDEFLRRFLEVNFFTDISWILHTFSGMQYGNTSIGTRAMPRPQGYHGKRLHKKVQKISNYKPTTSTIGKSFYSNQDGDIYHRNQSHFDDDRSLGVYDDIAIL